MLIERLASVSSRLFASVVVIRYLGPEYFGALSYSVGFASVAMTLARIGIDAVAVRAFALPGGINSVNLGAVVLPRIVASLVVYVIAIASALSFSPGNVELVTSAILISQVFFTPAEVMEYVMQASREIPKLVAVKIAANILISAILLYATKTGENVVGIAAITATGYGLQYILTIVIMRGTSWIKSEVAFEKQAALGVVKDSLPLLLGSISVILYMRVDVIMLGSMSDALSVGLYATASKVSDLAHMVPSTVALVLFPSLIRLKEASMEAFMLRLQGLLEKFTIFSYLAILFSYLFGADMIQMLFGAQYRAAGGILMIHIMTLIFVSHGVLRGRYLLTLNLQRYSVYSALLGGVVNVILNLLLIPKYGVTGAAVATLLAQFLATFLCSLFYKASRTFFKMQMRALLLTSTIRQIPLFR